MGRALDMEMQTLEADEARKLLDFVTSQCERKSGLGDLVFRIETRTGEERLGCIVERDGESSPDGILLNDGESSIRYDDIVWIGLGFGL